MNRTLTLSVGGTHHLRFGKGHIVYAGMPSEDVEIQGVIPLELPTTERTSA
jgi:hypothetical protein